MDPQADQAERDAEIAASIALMRADASPDPFTITEGPLTVHAELRKGAKPTVRVRLDGALLHMDVFDLTSSRLREKYASIIPEPHRATVAAALLTLADRCGPTDAITESAKAAKRQNKVMYAETTPAESPVVLADVLTMARAQIARNAILPRHADVVVALWTALTHFIEHLHYFGILHVLSATRECGKTRVLELVKLLSLRAWAMVNPTLAPLFRQIEDDTPTVIIDELDAISSDRLSDFTALLNDGVRRGGCIPRVSKSQDGAYAVDTFSVFCAKAIGSIGVKLPEATVSRTIRIAMQRATPAELKSLPSFREDRAERWAAPIRGYLTRAAADFGPQLAAMLDRDDDEPAVPLPEGVDGRQAQIWESLVALADLAGGPWPELARGACVTFVHGLRDAEAIDPMVRLLADTREYFAATDHGFVTSTDLITWLTADESRGWQEHHRDKPITPHALARLFKELGIKPKQRRSPELPDGRARCWARADFPPVWARYLTEKESAIPFQESVTGVTSVTSVTEDLDVTDNPAGAVSLVTDVTDVTLSQNTPNSFPCSVCGDPKRHFRSPDAVCYSCRTAQSRDVAA